MQLAGTERFEAKDKSPDAIYIENIRGLRILKW